MPPILEARDLHFSYRSRHVLSGASLAIGESDVVSLLGANGAGKSTLLRLLLGLERPSKGDVLLDGYPIRARSRRQIAKRLAYVPQSHVSPFPYSVRQVVMMGRLGQAGLFHAPRRGDHDAVDSALDRLGILHLAGRVYTQISGGERQLTLLCRALVQEASVLILDEPTAALDFGHQIRFLRQLHGLAADGYAVIMTTHHPDQAMAASNRAILLQNGRIAADGAPEQVINSDSIRSLYGVSVDIAPSLLQGLVRPEKVTDANEGLRA